MGCVWGGSKAPCLLQHGMFYFLPPKNTIVQPQLPFCFPCSLKRNMVCSTYPPQKNTMVRPQPPLSLTPGWVV